MVVLLEPRRAAQGRLLEVIVTADLHARWLKKYASSVCFALLFLLAGINGFSFVIALQSAMLRGPLTSARNIIG